MKMQSVLERLKQEHDLERSTATQYQRAVNRLSEYLERPAVVDDLDHAKINTWLSWLATEKKLGPCSVQNHRAGIIRLWSFASDVLELCQPCPTRRIRRPKIQQKIVKAWTLDEFDVLLQSASTLAGQLKCGIPAKTFLTAWLWIGYETGLRPIDLRLLEWSAIDMQEQTITVVQHKTGAVHTAFFGPESAEALDCLKQYGQSRVFPLCKWGVRRWEGYLFRAAEKLGFRRGEKQGLGTLRKTHATQIYRQYGLAAAAESLGHSSGTAIARKHYVDSREQRRIVPPSPRRTG